MTDLSAVHRQLARPRPVRAPRGTALSCAQLADRGRLPHAAEQPRPRGGREPGRPGGLRRHRQGGAQLGLLRGDPRQRCARSSDDETLLVQSGKPVGVFRTHADAPRVLIANSNLVPNWATWEHFNELDRKGLMMYGQMTAGCGSTSAARASCRAPTRPSSRPAASTSAATWPAAGSSPPASAAWAARSRWPRPSPAPRSLDHRMPAVAHRFPPAQRATSTSRRATSTTRWRASQRYTRREARRLDRPARQRRRAPARAGAARAGRRHPARPGHRPDLARTTWSTATCRPAGASSAGARRRPTPAQHAALRDAAAASCAVHVQAMLDFQAHGRAHGRLRQQHPPGGVRRRRRRTPSTSPASCRPTSGRCSAAARGRSAGSRCRGDPEDIRKTDAKMKELFPRRRAPAPLARHGRRAHRLPGPAGAHLLDRPGRAPPRRPGLQRDGEARRAEGADRDRPRPPRLRLGRVARTARPRRCGTAPTRSPTGRC